MALEWLNDDAGVAGEKRAHDEAVAYRAAEFTSADAEFTSADGA
ncbi:hypothetical protein ACIGXF_20625 [Streptomyces sp. NPDC053086]